MVVMVVLGIAIWLIVSNKTKDLVDGGMAIKECEAKDDLYDINVCIEDVYNDTGDVAVVVRGYDSVIARAKEMEDYWLAAKLITSRTSLLAVNEHCNEAMNLARSENMEGFDAKELGYIYSYAVGSSSSCGDEQAKATFSELLNNIEVEPANAENR